MSERLGQHDYLWNPSASPDEDIRRLEDALAPLRYRADRTADAPASPAPRVVFRPVRRPDFLSLAAAIAAVFLLAWFFTGPGGSPGGGAWSVRDVSGIVRIGSQLVDDDARLAIGEALETDSRSRGRLDVADIGSLTVHPNSRLRLVRSTAREHRLALDRGRIDALIYAPPRLFFVDTPSAVAVDLGCAYSLVVDDDGGGRIEVTFGWVALENDGRVSTIPTDGVCYMHPSRGPGTPFFEDAPPELVEALRRFDFEEETPDALAAILQAAHPRDSLTLWHLLARVPEGARGPVVDRIEELSELPAGITKAALRRLDAAALDRTWTALRRTW